MSLKVMGLKEFSSTVSFDTTPDSEKYRRGVPIDHADSQQIADYIANFVRLQSSNSNSLLMPSLKELMDFFHTSEDDVQDAFKSLKNKGYEFVCPGLYGQISYFKKAG